MRKQIIRRPLNEAINTSADDMHPLLQRVYSARNINSSKELDKNLDNLLPYNTLLNMSSAVALLADAVKKNKRIFIL